MSCGPYIIHNIDISKYTWIFRFFVCFRNKSAPFHEGKTIYSKRQVYLRYLQKDPGIHFISSYYTNISSRNSYQILDSLQPCQKGRPPATRTCGEIGLVDLEEGVPEVKKSRVGCAVAPCFGGGVPSIVRIFPYHFSKH